MYAALRRSCERNLPPEKKEMSTTKRASIGLNEPLETLSSQFRSPTILKSIDRQCGQREENSATVLRIMEESIRIAFTGALDCASVD